MANLGRGDDGGETTLAAATAAIITARWGAPARPQRRPAQVDDFVALAGPGAAPTSAVPASSVPVSPSVVPVPVITVPESSVPFSPFTPVSPAVAPPAAPPAAPVERVGGRASVGGDRRLPPPLAGADGFADNGRDLDDHAANGYGSHGYDASGTGHEANGYGANGYGANGHGAYGHGADGYASGGHDGDEWSTGGGFGRADGSGAGGDGGLPGRTPGSSLGGGGYPGTDDFRAFGPSDPAQTPAGATRTRADAFFRADRGRAEAPGSGAGAGASQTYRGAASPPPMFTPATSIPVPEVFSGTAPVDAPHPYPPADPFPAPTYEPPTLTETPHPPADGPASSQRGSRLLAAASASAAALLDSGLGAAGLGAAGLGAAGLGAAGLGAAGLGAAGLGAAGVGAAAAAGPSAPPAVDEFAGSVMSGMTMPKPFIPEPYDPGAFSLPDFDLSTEIPSPEPVPAGAPATWADTASAENRGAAGTAKPRLPKRVPSIPDVPDQFLPNDPAADGFELTKIASFFRDGRIDATDDRPDGFDVTAVLQAVRSVAGVKEAQLRWNSGYGHTLRVEFVPGADEGEVTREVARMLRETMGLAAQPGPIGAGVPNGVAGTVPAARLSPEENTLERQRRSAGAPRANRPAGGGVSRVVLDHVQVSTLGTEATVDVRLSISGGQFSGAVAKGARTGPAVDAYLLRLAADAAADAVDHLLLDPTAGDPHGRCVVEHVAIVPFGAVEVAVVVALVMAGAEATKVAGSAIVAGDPRHAVVRATLSAANRRLEALLS